MKAQFYRGMFEGFEWVPRLFLSRSYLELFWGVWVVSLTKEKL